MPAWPRQPRTLHAALPHATRRCGPEPTATARASRGGLEPNWLRDYDYDYDYDYYYYYDGDYWYYYYYYYYY